MVSSHESIRISKNLLIVQLYREFNIVLSQEEAEILVFVVIPNRDRR
jgi:hypothetical protein